MALVSKEIPLVSVGKDPSLTTLKPVRTGKKTHKNTLVSW